MPQCTSELLNEQNFLAARLTLAFGWTFFGVYILAFVAAVRHTCHTATTASRRLRILLLVLFTVVTTYEIVSTVRIVGTLPHKVIKTPTKLTVMTTVLPGIENILLVAATAIGDGLVAWRLTALYKAKRSTLLLLMTATVAIPAATGLAFAIVQLVQTSLVSQQVSRIYHHRSSTGLDHHTAEQVATLARVTPILDVVWAWLLVIVNLGMTLAIVLRVLKTVAWSEKAAHNGARSSVPYRAMAVAFVESAFLAWVDVLIWASLLASEIKVFFDGNTFSCDSVKKPVRIAAQGSFPPILGLCQCLIVIRLGQIKRNEHQNARHVPHLPISAIRASLGLAWPSPTHGKDRHGSSASSASASFSTNAVLDISAEHKNSAESSFDVGSTKRAMHIGD